MSQTYRENQPLTSGKPGKIDELCFVPQFQFQISRTGACWGMVLTNQSPLLVPKAGLTLYGCYPKRFTYSQPVSVPCAYRDGRLQRIVWRKN